MKHLRLIVIGLIAIVGIGFALAPAVASAEDTTKKNIEKICDANPKAAICDDLKDPNSETKLSGTFRNIINILLFIAGTIAIIMIIISGIKFTTAHGDSGAATKARQTLIYSVVGLVIAIVAFAIVNFIIGKLGESSSNGGGGSTPTTCTIPGQIEDPATHTCACPGGVPATGSPLKCPSTP